MHPRLRQAAAQGLIVLDIFVLFLLLFSERLVLPYWLQPVGRMHLMLLHFPLVLLGIAVWLPLLGLGKDNAQSVSFVRFGRAFLWTGTWLAGLTVVMGLFLSREDGYAGDALNRHRWTGAILFFAASLLCLVSGKLWSRKIWTSVSALSVTGLLLMTGHYGATLTHGDGFILQPIVREMNTKPVSIDQAVVYSDVIQPILERKCVTCHNPNKYKGELLLTDSMGLLKGGKTGPLFVPGNSLASLMMERIHLPIGDEKHMPPEGNAQLTSAEITLLSLWIDHGIGFHEKLLSLPEDDSLRVMAAAYFMPVTDSSSLFDFPAADEALVAKLTTPDRNISHVSRQSPALEVSIYRRDGYGLKQLEELMDIRQQVVTLKLNKLPVGDDDLKVLGRFENLRRLELNFSDVTDKGMGELAVLKQLRTLSLSGTQVSYEGLRRVLPSFGTLQRLTLWNTMLSARELSGLRQTFPAIDFVGVSGYEGRDTLTLNPPQVKNSTLVFRDSVAVQLAHPVRGAEIRYTLDGSAPDSIRSTVFRNTIQIAGNTRIMARAYKSGWYGSEAVQFDFLKNAFVPDSLRLLYPLNNVHLAAGAQTFFDTKLGVFGANNPAWANFWAGARKNDMGLVCLFNKPVSLSTFGLHYMVEEETGIHPPEVIEVWGGADEKSLKRIATIRPERPVKKEKLLKIAEASFPARTVSCLKIIAKPPVDLKSKKPRLILVDEMFLN
jgi:uncharacterized membrane protein